MKDFLVTPSGIALILSSAIFIITIFLVAIRAIGFWITLLLLTFSLSVGVIVGNIGALREYLRCRNLQQYEEHLKQIQQEVQGLKKILEQQELSNLQEEKDSSDLQE